MELKLIFVCIIVLMLHFGVVVPIIENQHDQGNISLFQVVLFRSLSVVSIALLSRFLL
jgi:hypothetical protein